MWLEYANSLACALLLALLMPVAVIVAPARHSIHAVGLICIAVAFTLQVVAPWADWVPDPLWPASILHIMLSAGALAWRRGIWLFLRVELGAVPIEHPIRRATDVAELLAGDPR